MIYIAAVLLILLLHVTYRYYKIRKAIAEDLPYITGKLNQIIEKQSTERLLIMTDEKPLQELLNSINSLLDYHQEYTAAGARMRMSMNRMLSNVSHDLKTPLTVILGYIETIQHDKRYTEEEQEVLLTKVNEKVNDVGSMISKFFDLAKLEADDWPLEMKPIDLNEICRKTILGYYDTLSAKGFDVVIDIPEEAVFINADTEAINRIIENLLSNAIRYGKDGKAVGLTMRLQEGNVLVEVWDKGRGILEQDAGKIFDRLYMLDDARSSSTEGSGLGLTIAKRLVERMNGNIDFSSVPYEKTVFTIQFNTLENVRNS